MLGVRLCILCQGLLQVPRLGTPSCLTQAYEVETTVISILENWGPERLSDMPKEHISKWQSQDCAIRGPLS